MTDLTNWLIEKQKEISGLRTDMMFCPANYYGSGTVLTVALDLKQFQQFFLDQHLELKI